MTSGGANRQVRRTDAAIITAFNNLLFERRYDDIRVSEIITLADVGRSTFYEHFRDKDDLLRRSLSGVMSVIAEAVEDGCDTLGLARMLEHFQEQRRLARGLMFSPSVHEVTAVMASLIEERLAARLRDSGATPAIPTALVAAQAAGALFGLLRAWLLGGHTCSAEALAAAMHSLTRASTAALLGE